MYRVLGCLTDQHDFRLVLLAAAICAATTATSFIIYSRVGHARRYMRLGWLFLTGVCTASGIWATHFVAMLAYQSGLPTAYDPGLTAGSLFIAIVAITLGYVICSGGSRGQVCLGGAVIGVGISLMHFTGMQALLIPGHITWDMSLVASAAILGAVIAAVATTAFHQLKGTPAVLAAAGILTLAICSMHFTAMAAATIVPDPTVAAGAGISADTPMMALAIAGLVLLVIIAGLAAALIDRQTNLDSIDRIRELVDAASEGIVIATDGVMINVNQRVSEMCGRPIADLVGQPVAGQLLHDVSVQSSNGEATTSEAILTAPDGSSIPVEVVCRPFRSGAQGTKVYAIRDLTERRRSEARIAHMARHDALTDLPNRILLRERLEPALTGNRKDEKVAVLCLDLDRFKEVNDTLGHPAGDALLKQVAVRLLECVRATDTVARVGGDEFVVVQISADPSKEVAALASRIIETVSAPFDLNGHSVLIGTSVGIAVSSNESLSADTLLAHADMALYRSKIDGGGTYCFFEQEMNARAHARRTLEQDLRLALANGELELAYQPLVNLERNDVSGFEALLRWRHPERGMVPPADFIPLAEETGLIIQIGEWVLRNACAEAATWPDHIKVAVNLSPVQFKSGKLVQLVFNAIASAGLAPHRLELEITESLLLQDSEATLAVLNQLHELGVRIAMDDFGTGYSSLSYLQKFPFHKIKIDRCFVANQSEDNTSGLAIVRAISSLGRALGLEITAEGVETQQQLDMVRLEGCTEMQGYLFSAAKPADEIRHHFLPRAEEPASKAKAAAA